MEDGEVAEPEPDPAFERQLTDARPDADELARKVLLSRVSSALFGEADPVIVGRYRLGRQLGRGGGGSVFVADDPELHREVAVKLIRCTSDRHRERALAEGRALAKLSHPNVVPVHDVGATAEHVYLVMELLRGESLRDYAGPTRSVRELVGAYRQAAAGLAAAHAVGLVHRDFKPDNAMFGDDHRVRVVDFGLATDAGHATAPAGTPRYMAPEQRAGSRTDATVDQYNLAASLHEAVTQDGRNEPLWLTRVLARATAEQPADRYPSMEALAAALGNDPRTRWKRRLLIGAPIALAIAGFGIGRGATSSDVETCAGGPEALAPAWSPARVDQIMRHVDSLATPFAAATAPLVREKLGKHGETWLAAHRQSCTAHARGELSDELYDRATVCLARSRIGVGEATELLATSSAARLDNAVFALSVVARADRCADPLVLAAEANPQPTPAMRVIDQQIEMAAIHARAATASAVALAQGVVSAARTNGDQRLLARALLVLGHATMYSDRELAIRVLHEAMLLGLANNQGDVATEAYARHAYTFAMTRPSAARARATDGLELVRAIGAGAGEHGAFARALLSNNVGAIALISGDFQTAGVEFRRAVHEATDVIGPDRVELVTAVTNLAMRTADPVERRRLYELAIAEVKAAVGPDHPETLDKLLQAAADGVDARTVVDELAQLCQKLTTFHPPLHGLVEAYAFELAWQATAVDLPEQARFAASLVRNHAGPPSVTRTLIMAYAALASGGGSPALVRELDQIAQRESAAIAEAGWYQNLTAADAKLALATAAMRTNDRVLAHRAAAQALEHLEAYRVTNEILTGSIERRIHWARVRAAEARRQSPD